MPCGGRVHKTYEEGAQMKLSKVKSLCTAAGRADLVVETNEYGDIRRQWISNGEGMWVITGMPTIGTDNLPTILGLSAKQTEKMRIGLQPFAEDMDGGDYDANDVVLTPAPCSIISRGAEYLLLTGAGKTLTVYKALLTPVWTEETQLVLRTRPTYGTPYIVILDGFFVSGIVAPVTGSILSKQDAAAIRGLIGNAD